MVVFLKSEASALNASQASINLDADIAQSQ